MDHAFIAGPFLGLAMGPKVVVATIERDAATVLRVKAVYPTPGLAISALAGDYDPLTGQLDVVVSLWEEGGQRVHHLVVGRDGSHVWCPPHALMGEEEGGRPEIRSLLLMSLPSAGYQYKEARPPPAKLLVAGFSDGRVVTIVMTDGGNGLRRQWFKVGRGPVRLLWIPPTSSQCAPIIYLNGDVDAVVLVTQAAAWGGGMMEEEGHVYQLQCLAVHTPWPRRAVHFLPGLSSSGHAGTNLVWMSSQGKLCFGELSLSSQGRTSWQALGGERPTHLHYHERWDALVVATKVSTDPLPVTGEVGALPRSWSLCLSVSLCTSPPHLLMVGVCVLLQESDGTHPSTTLQCP